MNGIADIAPQLPDPVARIPLGSGPSPEALRTRVQEFVGLTFFAPLLKQASETVLRGEYGHGGRGEEVFRGQLNEVLAMRIGQSERLGLVEGIVERLSAGQADSIGRSMDQQA